MRSNTLLHLEKDASLLGTPDLADYPVTQVRWEGKWIQGHVGLICAIGASNIGITGSGRIVGNPAVGGRPNSRDPLRHPALVEPIGCTNVLLEGFSATACIGIGSETSGGIRNIRIERCTFTSARTYAIYIKSRVGRGAFMEDISANDLTASGLQRGFLQINALTSGLQDQDPVSGKEGIPQLRNFRFSNLKLQDCAALADVTLIHPAKPLEGFAFINVTGTCMRGISLANIRRAEIHDVKLSGLTGPLLRTFNVTGKGLKGAVPLEPPKIPDLFPKPSQPYHLH